MIASDKEFEDVQGRIRTIQGMLAHARRTLTPDSFQAQSRGWLKEWERLEAEAREYLSSPVDTSVREPAGVA